MTPQWAILSSLAAAIVGGLLVHFLTLLRDARSEARRLRTELMIRAYRTIVTASNHESLTLEDGAALELAFNDLMLLGNARQVEAAAAVITDAQEDGTMYFDTLVDALRDDLRSQLGLPTVELSTQARYFQIGPPDASPRAL